MGSRTWLAVALCILIWMVYINNFAPKPPIKTTTQGTKSIEQVTQSPEASSSLSPASQPSPLSYESSDLIAIENESAEFLFHGSTARMVEVVLKGYKHSPTDQNSQKIRSLHPKNLSGVGYFRFNSSDLSELNQAQYKVLSQTSEQVVFEGRTSQSDIFTVSYSLTDNPYLIEVRHSLVLARESQPTGHFQVMMAGTGLKYDYQKPLEAWELVAFQSEDLNRWAYKDLDKTETLVGNTSYLAFGNRYFSNAFLPKKGVNPDVTTLGDSYKGGELNYPLHFTDKRFDIISHFYSGPKKLEYLDGAGLKSLVDYGMFSFLAYPMLAILKFFYQFVKNYGVAIILLTLLVRLLFYPLTMKSMKSMKNMQKLQPEIEKLKKEFGDDREKMSRAQMELFKKHKINPAAGCLPMLIQLPVFFALYQLLGNSMELFHAPFFGWVHDLSAKDPYYIYPILMGISMFAQQLLTPSPGMDPTQRKIMFIMPLVFSFVMINLPAGLTLYIFVSTILGIAQQFLTKTHSPLAAM